MAGYITAAILAHPWLAAILAILGVVVGVVLIFDASLTARLRHIPGPPPWPVVGHVPYMLKEPWRVFADYSRKYGSVYLFRLFTKPMVVISDPDLVRQCFRDREALYLKDQWSYDYFRDILGYGLVTSEGKVWRAHRTLMMPAFDFKALARLQRIFETATNRLLANLDVACKSAVTRTTTGSKPFVRSAETLTPAGDGTCVMEISSTFRQVTLEVISEVALGMNPNAAAVFPQLFEVVLDELNERPFHPWRSWVPTIEWPHRANIKRLNDLVTATIASRRAERKHTAAGSSAAVAAAAATAAGITSMTAAGGVGDDADALQMSGSGAGVSISGKVIFEDGDMLDMLLDSGGELSDRELSDEVKTMLLAGHETSAMMLTWATYLLAANPAAMARAVAEVDEVLGVHPSRAATAPPGARVVEKPTFDDYRGLRYLECVLKEAMRLYSPVPLLNRELQADDTLGEFRIPAGSTIVVSIWSIHMNPEIWGPDVADFRPDRFLPEETKRRHPWSFMPFSLGARSCIGQNLAYTEAKTVLGGLLRSYSLALPPDHTPPVTDKYVMPLRPAERLNVIVTPRK